MAKLWVIIKREYLERVRSKWFLIATFFGPIFFSAIIIVPAWLASRSKATTDVYNTTILDATDTGFGHRLAVNIAGDSTNSSRMPTVRLVPPSELTKAESTATHEVMRKERSGYIVVNQQTLAGESARYAGTNATSIADMAQIKTAIHQTILASRLEKEGLNAQRLKEITFIPLEFSTERITERGRAGSGMASVLFGFAIGFLLYLSIVIYGQTIMSGVLECSGSHSTDTLDRDDLRPAQAARAHHGKAGRADGEFLAPRHLARRGNSLPAVLPARLHLLLVTLRRGWLVG